MLEYLPVGDVEALVRLLGEIAGTDDPVPAKKRRLVAGLARLVGTDVYVWAQCATTADGANVVYSYIDGGYASDDQRRVAMGPDLDPAARPVADRALETHGRHLTRTRAQVFADAEWYESAFYRTYRLAAGLDDFLFSVYPVRGGRARSIIGLHRATGAAPFGDRERCLVHVVTSQVDWLHRAGSELPSAGKVAELSPRQRQVLLLLLGGDGRKQIARKLNLSEHTVGDYLKALHRHCAVSSRGELLAKFMAGEAAAKSA